MLYRTFYLLILALFISTQGIAQKKGLLKNDSVFVHQVVSPNGDGVNDYLIIDGITAYPDNRLYIVNTNGSLVFEASNYGNSSSNVFTGHSGTDGTLLKKGSYYYSFEYMKGSEKIRKTGCVVLKY